MRLNLDWNKDFQEFQDILNSGIHPEWLYCAKANLVLEPAYTGEGKQFFSTQDIIKASKIKEGKHGVNFMVLLEQRLDNVVYRLGLATTRRQARQLVNHGHIEVDGGRVDIPSYSLKPGQVITVREKSQNLDIIKESVEINNFVPEYLDFDADNLKGTFVRFPERSELPAEINEQLIVEYYSR
mgnify:CR=1 FL=1